MITRRGAMAVGLGAGANLVFGQAASARPLIALPEDIVADNGATVTAVRTPSSVVAITFDDGPHPRHTPRLLDILAKRKIRATFYLIGERVLYWPDIVRRIATEGHEIGNHSWSHPFLNRLNQQSVYREIDRTTDAIYQITGRPPVTFRPPYGAFSHQQRTHLHTHRNLPTVLWSVDPQDWRRPGPGAVGSRILRGSHKGAIILSHDIHQGTVDAMPHTLDTLLQRGFKFGTVSQMLGWPLWQSRTFKRVVQQKVG